jgi:hypothetical protein
VGDPRLRLHAGEGYFYFAFEAEGIYETHSVYVYRLRDFSLERWVSEGKEFISACEEEMKQRSASTWKPGTPIRLSYRKC